MKDYKEHHRHSAKVKHTPKPNKKDVIEIAGAVILFGLMYLLLTIVMCF